MNRVNGAMPMLPAGGDYGSPAMPMNIMPSYGAGGNLLGRIGGVAAGGVGMHQRNYSYQQAQSVQPSPRAGGMDVFGHQPPPPMSTRIDNSMLSNYLGKQQQARSVIGNYPSQQAPAYNPPVMRAPSGLMMMGGVAGGGMQAPPQSNYYNY